MGGYCHITRRITVAAIIDIEISSASRTWTVQRFPEGGGLTKKNGSLDLRQHQFYFVLADPPPRNGEHIKESERKIRKDME